MLVFGVGVSVGVGGGVAGAVQCFRFLLVVWLSWLFDSRGLVAPHGSRGSRGGHR